MKLFSHGRYKIYASSGEKYQCFIPKGYIAVIFNILSYSLETKKRMTFFNCKYFKNGILKILKGLANSCAVSYTRYYYKLSLCLSSLL